MVGSANGKSIKASTNHLPGKLSRTSTHAIATPMTALMAATESESHSESRIALIAPGAVIAAQNVWKPALTLQRQNAMPHPCVWMVNENPCATTAAMGMSTMIDR